MQGRIILGARVEDACQGPAEYSDALESFSSQPFALTYRPETQRAYVLLKEGACTSDALCGAFHAHVLLHMMDAVDDKAALPIAAVLPSPPLDSRKSNAPLEPLEGSRNSPVPLKQPLTALRDVDDVQTILMQVTAAKGQQLYDSFVQQAADLGWQLQNTMLNPKEARLLVPHL